jgi:O-acetylserine/cysteine efflux transporter
MSINRTYNPIFLRASTSKTRAVAALVAAGVAWGTSVPLSKAALGWLAPGWLTAVRFTIAAVVLLLTVDRRALREALCWPVLGWGAVGLGASVTVQNIGIDKTSVTHAALLIGAGPVLVAIIAAAWHHVVARPVAWVGFLLSLAGVAVIAGGPGGGASGRGDVLVLASTLIVAAMTVAQGRLLEGRDPAAVTAVEFLGAAVATLAFALGTEGLPALPLAASGAVKVGPVLAVAALAVVGTLVPFTLFAYGQRRVSTEIAGAFLNLEPLVGALVGIVAFGDPAGPRQFLGGAAIIAGIALSSMAGVHITRPHRPEPAVPEPAAPAMVVRELAGAGRAWLQAEGAGQVRDRVHDQRRARQAGRGGNGLEFRPAAVA